MDMSKMAAMAATMPITADDMESVLRSAEPMMPEAAIIWSRRMLAALRAAEKMADAIEKAEDSRYSMTPAAKAAWEFRKAMRGEL